MTVNASAFAPTGSWYRGTCGSRCSVIGTRAEPILEAIRRLAWGPD